jgi:hypothetical protein
MESTPQDNLDIKTEKAPPAFLLESGFFSDPKTLRLIDKHGPGAALQVLHIWSWLTNSADGRLDYESALVLGRAAGMGCDVMSQVIQTALDLKLLYKEQDGSLFHPTIMKAREKFFSKRRNYVEARNKRVGVQAERSVNPARILPEFSTAPINITNTNHNTNNKLYRSEGSAEGNQLPPPEMPSSKPPEGQLESFAEEMLTPETSEVVRKSRVYITTGRRPLKDYPNVWLNRAEFVMMLEQFQEAKVVKRELKHLLAACEAGMLEKKGKGIDPQMTSSFKWLTGFLLEDYLKKRKAKLDLERSEAYLVNAKEAARV